MATTLAKPESLDGSSSKSGPTTVVARENAGYSSDEETLPPKTWKSYLWDTLDKPPKEKKFLFKLDAIILTFASLGYFIKNLDQININNAYVTGMKEDMNMYGNELNIMQTMWTIGYVIGEIPR